MALILLQLLLLFATSAGWAFWLKRLLRIESQWNLSLTVLLFATGFAAQILFLQNLVYFDYPVGSTFWIPGAIGLLGLERARSESVDISIGDRNVALVVFGGVFLLQASTAFLETPTFYYGKGHPDQYNYATLSQFVQTQRFHSIPDHAGLQPWLTRAHEFKVQRIGQSVAQAYTASLTFSSAKEAYAALSTYCLSLVALMAFTLARAIALPCNLAALASVWTGLAPALTRYHLEGFLSQSVTIFVLPFLALWARATTFQAGYAIGLPAIALAYLLVSYVELLPVGIVVFGGLALWRLYRDGWRTVWQSVATVVISMLLVPMATASSFKFLVLQMERAGQRYHSLEAQAALAGTIPGWIHGLVKYPLLVYPLQLATAMVLVGLAVFALSHADRRNRAFLLAVLLPPIIILAYLFLKDPIPKYPFAKIQDSFAYLWILLPLAGFSRLRAGLRRIVPMSVFGLVPVVVIPFAAFGTFEHHRPIIRHLGSLEALQTKEVISAIQYAESHPGETYLIKSPESNVAGWLAYHARNSKAYLSPPRLADFTIPSGAFAFTKVPDRVPGMILLSTAGVRVPSRTGEIPILTIRNRQGEERDATNVWYWIGDSMELELSRWDDDDRLVEYKLKMRVEPGPSNPSTYRRMRLTSSRTGISTPIETKAGEAVTVPIILAPGLNPFFLEIMEPTQATVQVAHDTRNLLVRILNPSVTDPRPIDKPDAALVKALAYSSLTPPEIVGLNPQGQDQGGGTSWFWINRRMELEIHRRDSDALDHIYQLTFRAEPGFANPSPSRTLRITHAETKTETIIAVTGASRPSLSVNLKPGLNHFELGIVEDLPQVVKAPGDGRVHMLRLEEFALRFVRANSAELPAAKRK